MQLQSLATQNSIRVLMCIVPALGIILAYVVFKTKYKLNDEFMKKVVAKISGKAEEIIAEYYTRYKINLKIQSYLQYNNRILLQSNITLTIPIH